MKTTRNIIVLLALTALLFGLIYPLAIVGIGTAFGDKAEGQAVVVKGRTVGYRNVGQPFSQPGYFWGRPSAVNYNAASTGGSNQGPTSPTHLQAIQDRVDTLLKYHPGLRPQDIPADLVTASGGGLDPHISKQAALLQVPRVAAARTLNPATVRQLVDTHTEGALLGFLGPDGRVNVLKLNIALDNLK